MGVKGTLLFEIEYKPLNLMCLINTIMKKLYLTLALCGLFTAFSAQAVVNVNVTTPGGLEQLLFDQTAEEYSAIETLNVTGTLNADDIATMKLMATDYALRTVDLSEANLVDNTLPNKAFNPSNLKSLTLPKSLVTMGTECFATNLEVLNIPTTKMTTIPEHAFTWCTKITELTIPEGVTSLGKESLCFCIALKTLRLPSTLNNIGEGAILGGVGFTDGYPIPLTALYIKNPTVPTIGPAAVCLGGGYWTMCTLYVPTGSVDAYKANVVDSWYGFGMIQNIEASNFSTSTKDVNVSGLNVYSSAKNSITIEGSEINTPVAIYTIAGTLVKSLKSNSEKLTIEIPNACGIYLVKVGTKTMKVAL